LLLARHARADLADGDTATDARGHGAARVGPRRAENLLVDLSGHGGDYLLLMLGRSRRNL
jgi:hypothetical protein